MYSVVLATMLAAGSSAPAWHGSTGTPARHFYGYQGCGYPGYNIRHRPHVPRYDPDSLNAHGCHGVGSSCWSCSGGCHGCTGCTSCHGCTGCHGCHGCTSCHGSSKHHHHHRGHDQGYAGYASNCSCQGCHGCHGCHGCTGVLISSAPTIVETPTIVTPAPVVIQPAPTVIQQAPPVVLPPPAPPVVLPVSPAAGNTLTPVEAETLRNLLQKATQPSGAQGPVLALGHAEGVQKTVRVTVMLPQDARLWVDQVECPLARTAVRSFDTQPLPANQQFAYSVKMEVMRDGRLVSATQHVLMTPGQDVHIDFNQTNALHTVNR